MGDNKQFGIHLSQPAGPPRLKLEFVPFTQSLPALRQPRLRLWPEFVKVPKVRMEVLISSRQGNHPGYQLLSPEISARLWDLLQRESAKQGLTHSPIPPADSDSQDDKPPDRFMYATMVPAPGTGQINMAKDIGSSAPSLKATYTAPSDDDRLELLFVDENQPKWSLTANVTANFDLATNTGLTSGQAQVSGMLVQPAAGGKINFLLRVKLTEQIGLAGGQSNSFNAIASMGANVPLGNGISAGVTGSMGATISGKSIAHELSILGGLSGTF